MQERKEGLVSVVDSQDRRSHGRIPQRVRHRYPTPFTLNTAPYTLRPTPYTLHPTPRTLHPTLDLLLLTPYTLRLLALLQSIWAHNLGEPGFFGAENLKNLYRKPKISSQDGNGSRPCHKSGLTKASKWTSTSDIRCMRVVG